MTDVADRVSSIVADTLKVNANRVTAESRFAEDLGADSVHAGQLVMAFEQEFNVELPEDVAEGILTVGDAVKLISERAGGA